MKKFMSKSSPIFDQLLTHHLNLVMQRLVPYIVKMVIQHKQEGEGSEANLTSGTRL